jgi:signal transduction histidine kinase
MASLIFRFLLSCSVLTVALFAIDTQGSPGAGLEGGESNSFADWMSLDLPNYLYLLSLPFYHISWFYLLCAVVMAGAGWAGYRMRIARSNSLCSAVQAERSRIAREMHDTLIQGVIGSMALLAAVSKTLEVSPHQAANYLEMARSELSKSLNDLRDAVISLREQMRETKILIDEIREMMQRLTACSPVHSRCEVCGEPRPLPNPIAENLIRIGREAIANAVRHSAANHLLVELRFALNWVELRVRDDGIGFDVESSAADGNSHFGLLGMRERAAAIEGELILDSRPGRGTEIAIRVMFD